MEFYDANSGRKMKARMFSASTKKLSVMCNVCSHFRNLFDGVKHKLQYRIRLGFTHFPISTDITTMTRFRDSRLSIFKRMKKLTSVFSPLLSALNKFEHCNPWGI